MARTVQLSDRAYAALAAHKHQNESFSDEVLRLLRERRDPRGLAGLGPLLPGFDLDAVRRKMRDGDLARARRLGRA